MTLWNEFRRWRIHSGPISTRFEEGYQAYLRSDDENPYCKQMQRDAYMQWLRGWHQADMDFADFQGDD